MSEPKRNLQDRVKAVGGMLSALVGVLVVVAQLTDNVDKISKGLGVLPYYVWWAIGAVLLIVGIQALLDGLARRSRLVRPEALWLDARKPEHLVGRKEEILQLVNYCSESHLLHLDGESGAGKSALVQAGLCPELKARGKLIPVCISAWGQDWEAGPRTALAEALWAALSADDRHMLQLTGVPQLAEVVTVMRRIRRELGRLPLLIFDQFDDYQTRHRSRFLPGRRRTWLSADALAKGNTFWRGVKDLLDEQAVHCLFVTRADTASGFESVRFLEPRVYRLDRLQPGFIEPFLQELIEADDKKPAAVLGPEWGWQRLKSRLARDLGQDGSVLPAQMKVVLQGLARLRALTITEYERVGGLKGLEAAHIEWHVNETARHAGLTKTQVLRLLLQLVDRDNLKTVPQSSQSLEEQVSLDLADQARLKRVINAALENLETKEIIRKRLDPDTRQHVWLLDHDYLCHPVLEAERRANQWLILAREGYRSFQNAGRNAWRRWHSLLTPPKQIMLAILWVCGRFRYGEVRRYALWSLLRFVPYLALIAVLSITWFETLRWQQDQLDRDKAQDLLKRISTRDDDRPIPSHWALFWNLAMSNEATRRYFLEMGLDESENVQALRSYPSITARALVGLDPDKRREFASEIMLPRLRNRPLGLDAKIACAGIGTALSIEDSAFTTPLIKELAEANKHRLDNRQVRGLSEALAALVANLDETQAGEACNTILDALPQAAQIGQAEALAEAVVTLAEKLDPDRAKDAFVTFFVSPKTIVIGIVSKRTEISTYNDTVVKALIALATRLDEARADQAFNAIRDPTQASNPYRLAAVSALAGRMSPAAAKGGLYCRSCRPAERILSRQ